MIPLGCEKGYFAAANDFDLSHVICKDHMWWADTIEKAGWNVFDYFDRLKGIKDTYDPGTHGFFIAKRV